MGSDVVKTTDPERDSFYCVKDSLMGAGLFEQVGLCKRI